MLDKEEQELRADIEIARKGLYVFSDSEEKNKWIELLDKAERETLVKNYIYARKLVERVREVIDKLWVRIGRWNDLQKLLTKVFVIVVPTELIGVAIANYYLNLTQYGIYTAMVFGLLGGTLSVALSIGKDLRIEISNRLQMFRMLLRPFIGVISGLILFSLLQTKILIVSPDTDSGSVLILLSMGAGFSERFIVKALSNYIPSLVNKAE